MRERSSYNLLFVVQEFFVTNFLRNSCVHAESLINIDFRSAKNVEISMKKGSFYLHGRLFCDHVCETRNVPVRSAHASMAGK